MFNAEQKNQLIQMVNLIGFVKIINADETFQRRNGNYTANDIADILEMLFFRNDKEVYVRRFSLVIKEPCEYTTMIDNVEYRGIVSGMVRIVGELSNGRKRFIKFVSHPFYQYGNRIEV